MSLRLVLADDHTVVLQGLKALLSMEPGMEVVALCTDGHEAVEAVVRDRPDVLVMDASMPGLGGPEAVERLKALGQSVPTVILSATLDDSTLVRCLALGVQGLVLKESAAAGLVDAIHAVARGEQWIPPLLNRRAIEVLSHRPDADEASLTPREREIVLLVAEGHSNKRVAADLDIAEGTVKLHLHKAYKKLGVTNRVQLSLLARERAWV